MSTYGSKELRTPPNTAPPTTIPEPTLGTTPHQSTAPHP